MSKIISVIGATGTQGGSVVDALQKDNSIYTIRAITRNPNSDAAQALTAKGIKVVQADASDVASLVRAFEGSSAIFALTDFVAPFAASGPDHAVEVESTQGINLAKAASQIPSLEHYIWSTLPNSRELSGGKIVVPHFDSKNRVDEYIKSNPALLSKTTFLLPGFFAENYLFPMLAPIEVPGTGQYLQLGCTSADSQFPSIGHARSNVGPFVSAILAQPEKTLPAKRVAAYTEVTSLGEMLETWSRVKGKKAYYTRVDRKVYDALFPLWGDEIGIMMEYFDAVPDTKWDKGGDTLNKDDLGVDGLVDVEAALRLY
ncbi:NmrA/HSCARG family protein [Aspergillus lucknowensis]|uniref:NmrA-like family protein-like protein n=1 Tax=Aspergillus lucknowensis TaxID=176173 RepID=A0ABR4LL39_9EURO